LFSAEGKGLFGIKHLGQKTKNNNFKPLCLCLNFEMVGVPLVGKDLILCMVTGYEESEFGDIATVMPRKKIIGFSSNGKEYICFKRCDDSPFSARSLEFPSRNFLYL